MSVVDGGQTGIDISLWNDRSPLAVRKVDCVRSTAHHGFLLSFIADSFRSPIYIAIAPIKTLDDGSHDFLHESDIPQASGDEPTKSPISLNQTNQERAIISPDGQSVILRLNINGCTTAKLKSPLRVLFYLLGVTPEADRTSLSHPIGVFRYYHEAGTS